jgi:hypothetical protein
VVIQARFHVVFTIIRNIDLDLFRKKFDKTVRTSRKIFPGLPFPQSQSVLRGVSDPKTDLLSIRVHQCTPQLKPRVCSEIESKLHPSYFLGLARRFRSVESCSA